MEDGSQGMKKFLQKNIFIILGWFFTLLGIIGVILPLLPTTPFLIVALVFFSKSSPRFHQMLLNNAWVGPTLKQWEATKTLSRKTKHKAIVLIVITFSVSIAIFHTDLLVQLLLVFLCIVLLIIIWRINERAE